MYNRPSGMTYKLPGRKVIVHTGRVGRPRKGEVISNLRDRWGTVVACVVRLRDGAEAIFPSFRVKVIA